MPLFLLEAPLMMLLVLTVSGLTRHSQARLERINSGYECVPLTFSCRRRHDLVCGSTALNQVTGDKIDWTSAANGASVLLFR